MDYAVSILTILLVFMLAGALPAKGGGQLAIFRTPVFILTLAALSVALLGCSFRRVHLKRIGFALCHLGVVVILAGALLGFVAGRKTQFAAPIAMAHGINRVPGPEETSFELPFALSVTDFRVESYDPEYHLYTPPESDAEYTFESSIDPPGVAGVDLGHGDVVQRGDLVDAQGEWVRQFILPSGRLLQMGDATPRHYEATLKLTGSGCPVRTEVLAVNHPVSAGGWRFYLMSYDKEARRYIVLSARKDPGRALVIVGIWALIVGTAWLCWIPRGKRATAAVSGDTFMGEVTDG